MARERYDVAGKTVLITGAATGIGSETARLLGARGARLALLDVNGAGLEQTAAGIEQAEPIRCDVTDPDQLAHAVAEAKQHFGGIDVVMANAGIAAPGLVEQQDPAEFERVIEVNLLGVYRTVKSTLEEVMARRGYVLVVASLAAPVHTPLMAQYSMAKSGVEAFGNTLRSELVGTGTRVGVAYFGFIDTPMVSGAMAVDPATEELRRAAGPLSSKTYPAEGAAAAVVDGIERRGRIVAYPPWTRPLLVARGIVQPLVDLQARTARFRRVIERARERGAAAAADAPKSTTTDEPAGTRS